MRLFFTFALAFILTVWVTIGANSEEPVNIVQNGDFENEFQHWSFWIFGAGGAIAEEQQIMGRKVDSIDGQNVAYVKIADGGGAFDHIQFFQGPITLKKDKEYTFSVWAKSDEEPRPARLSVLHHMAPWTRYEEKKITFENLWNEYSVTFTQPVDDDEARAEIFLGSSDVDVWIDHVRLYEGEYFNDEVRDLPEARGVDLQDKLTTTWGKIKAR